MVHHSGEVDSRIEVDFALHRGAEGKYEEYREAWKLLREASGIGENAESPLLATSTRSGAPTESGASSGEDESDQEQPPTGPGVVRMQNAFAFIRRQLERGGRMPR